MYIYKREDGVGFIIFLVLGDGVLFFFGFIKEAGRGGGVGFILKNGFPIKNQQALKFKSFEVTEAVILAKERIKMCLMFRPGFNKPNTELDSAVSSF